MQKTWDYTELAAHYDKRPDYCPLALDRFIDELGLVDGRTVADVGAGTGKLARAFAQRGLHVDAVEPNAEMRRFGVHNTSDLRVVWHCGTGEETGLSDSAFDLVSFGSSFNVVNQPIALTEAVRILKPRGWFMCVWNHRDLRDPIQAKVESVIRTELPCYTYGDRRSDPTIRIEESGYFKWVKFIEERFCLELQAIDYIEAWQSHATLQRQAGHNFDKIIDKIATAIRQYTTIKVPYFTRLWFAGRR
jgi:ubiquinone/menaquinone biosynthesis C-methylase UbiE